MLLLHKQEHGKGRFSILLKQQSLFNDNAIVISSILGKGGGGKTSLIANLSGVLIKNHQKNCIVDLDAQGNISDAFGLKESRFTALNMFTKKVKNTSNLITKYNAHLDIIQATEDMATLELDLLLNMSQYDEPFSFVKPHIEVLRPNYEIIFIDTPPQLSLMVGNALASSDYILIPFVPEPYSVKGLKRVVRSVSEFQQAGMGVKILAVVPMFVKSSTNLHNQLLEQARRYCASNDIYMTETVIPHSILFANATAYQSLPATLGRDKSNEIVKNYNSLWAELSVQLKMQYGEVIA